MICNLTANYSLVEADRVLPFVFTLDTAASNLYPGEGENQRFCYRVQGIGEDTSAYADMSHFVLGVCDQLALSDVLSAEVVVDGVPQQVVLGQNVEVRTPENPDPPTGCPGLKFDFGLDKVGGVMTFCFTLARTFAVGDVPLCVNGGQTTVSSLVISGPACAAAASCTATVSQRATVCVPVTITPFASVGVIDTLCTGAPTLTPGTDVCEGAIGESCTFTLTQELCLNIPVAFGATAEPGEARTLCAGSALGACDAEAGEAASGAGCTGRGCGLGRMR